MGDRSRSTATISFVSAVEARLGFALHPLLIRVYTEVADGDIVTHDDAAGAAQTTFHLATWLGAWVSGVDLWKEIYEDKVTTILNPFTRKPVETKIRGAAKGAPWRAG